tara:strand:- start:17882 stop:18217 length:336 start_codon:yes stop_codon:yes gene_type:complete
MSDLENDRMEELAWFRFYKKKIASLLACNEDWGEIDDAIIELIDERSRMQKTIGELRGKLSAITAALEEALDEWEYSSQYKGDYLQEKHHDLDAIREMREKFIQKKDQSDA